MDLDYPVAQNLDLSSEQRSEDIADKPRIILSTNYCLESVLLAVQSVNASSDRAQAHTLTVDGTHVSSISLLFMHYDSSFV